MSYPIQDESQSDSSPVLLYQFANGSTAWRHCTLTFDFVHGGNTWTPLAIRHGESKQTTENDGLTLTIPLDCALAQAHLGDPLSARTTLTIFRRDFATAETEVRYWWKGTITRPAPDGASMTFECEPLGQDLSREGHRRFTQRMCPYVLFGQGCSLPRTGFARASHATAVSGRILTVTEAAAMTDIDAGEVIDSHGNRRTIISHDGANLLLTWPIRGIGAEITAALPAGLAVDIYPGCRRTASDCYTRFGNIGHFGGLHGMAGMNPMDAYSNVWGV